MPVPSSLPVLDDEVTFARYPFLPQAGEWIRNMAIEHNIDLDELLDGSWMEKARSRARIRLIDSIQSKEGVEVVGGEWVPVGQRDVHMGGGGRASRGAAVGAR